MFSYICEYDLDVVYCRNRGIARQQVYIALREKLEARNYFRSQYSVWKKHHTTFAQEFEELSLIANEIEAQFFQGEQGIFKHFEFQRFTQQTTIRGVEVEG